MWKTALAFSLFGLTSSSVLMLSACPPSPSGEGEGEGEGAGEGEGEGEGAGEGEGEGEGAGATPLLDDAIQACAWAEACFDAESGANAIAPNVDVSSCIEGYIGGELELTSNGGITRRFDVFRDCALAAPATCADYRQCVADAGAATVCTGADTVQTCDGDVVRFACQASEGFAPAVDCASVGVTCSGGQCTALPACSGNSSACGVDGTFIDQCGNDTPSRRPCGDLSCVELSFGGGPVEPTCAPGIIGTCATDGATCDGDTVVACTGGTEVRVDCSQFGRVCHENFGVAVCQAPASTCDFNHHDTCNGDVLTICANGDEQVVDCAALGGTCGTLRSGLDGCLFP